MFKRPLTRLVLRHHTSRQKFGVPQRAAICAEEGQIDPVVNALRIDTIELLADVRLAWQRQYQCLEGGVEAGEVRRNLKQWLTG